MKTSIKLMRALGLDESCINRLTAFVKPDLDSQVFEVIDLIGDADTNDIVQYLIAEGETTTILSFALYCVEISFKLVKEEQDSNREGFSRSDYETTIYKADTIFTSLKTLFRATTISNALRLRSESIKSSDSSHDAFSAVNAAVNLSLALGSIEIGAVTTTLAQKAIGEAIYAILGDKNETTLMREVERFLQAVIRDIDNA